MTTINRIEKARLKLLAQGKPIINLSSGNPAEFGINFPAEILAEGFKNFQKNPNYQAHPKGEIAARIAISQFYAQRNFSVDPEKIIITSSTAESYLHLFKLLAQQNEEILFPNPAYPLFEHLAKLAGISLNHYQLDAQNNWQIDLQNLTQKISKKTKAIVIISPNNPTGGVLTTQNLEAVLAIAAKNNLPIISDEVFSEFIYDGANFPRIASITSLAGQGTPTIFTLNGISKTYALPGLKLSWIVVSGPQPTVSQYIDELELSIDTLLASNQVAQMMLPQIIANGDPFLNKFRARLQKSRDTAIAILNKNPNISFVKPAGGFYLFAQIKNFPGTDEDFVLQILERTGIFVHPGYFYDYEKGIYVLISLLPSPAEITTILEKFVEVTNELCSK